VAVVSIFVFTIISPINAQQKDDRGGVICCQFKTTRQESSLS